MCKYKKRKKTKIFEIFFKKLKNINQKY